MLLLRVMLPQKAVQKPVPQKVKPLQSMLPLRVAQIQVLKRVKLAL